MATCATSTTSPSNDSPVNRGNKRKTLARAMTEGGMGGGGGREEESAQVGGMQI